MEVERQLYIPEPKPEIGTATHQITYKLFGSSVCLKADRKEFIDFTDLYFDRYFERSADMSVDFVVDVNSDAGAFSALWKTLPLNHAISVGEAQLIKLRPNLEILIQQCSELQPSLMSLLLIDKERSHVTLMLPGSNPVLRYVPMRLVRLLISVLLLRQGRLAFHGACIVKAGVGLCLLGGKRSGKTTTMINALLNGNYDFLSNSRIIVERVHGVWRAYGPPIAAGIRVGTLRHFDSLQRLFTNYTELHDDNHEFSRESLQHPETRLYVKPQQLAKLLQCSITPRAPIKCFVVPEISATVRESTLVPMPLLEANSRLAKQWLAEMLPEQRYWNDFFGVSSNNDEILSQLAQDVRMYRLVQTAGTNAQSLCVLDSLVNSREPRT